MAPMPIPDRIMLNSAGASRGTILRDISRRIATDLGLHPVGIHEFLTSPDQGMIETRLLPGLLVLDGCLTGVTAPYTAIIRPARPVMMGAMSPYPAEIIVLSLSPDADHTGHVQRISRMTRLLKRSDIMATLKSAAVPDDIMALFLADGEAVRAA